MNALRLDGSLRIRSLCVSVLLAWLVVSPAGAGPTDPQLAINRVESGSAFVSWVEIHGIFPAADLVQLAYPVQILVRNLTDGTRYVRYPLDGYAVEGSSLALADGLDAADVPALLAEGAPAANAPILFMGEDRLEVQLPASFPSGPTEVQLFVLDPGEIVPVLSNAVVFVIPGAGS